MNGRRVPASLLLALLVAVLLSSGAPARAQDRSLMMMIDGRTHRISLFVRTRYPQLRLFAARSEALMRQYLNGTGRYECRPIHRLIAAGGLADAASAVKEGGELLQQGFAAYRHDRFAEAEQALGKAMRSLEQGAALLDNPVSLIQAHQLMGQLQLKQGKTREAISWFRRAITLAPASPLDPSVFPGETIEVYERTRQEATAESSRLEVSSAPRGAAVLLDGRFVGVTPVELKLDTAGRHLLQLNADGFLPEGTAIDLQPGKTAKLQRSLKPVRHADSFLEVLERAMDGLGEEELTSDSGIHELGELLEVEELVLVRMSATRDKQAVVEGFHYDFLDGQLINVGDRLFSPGGKSLEQDAAQFVDDLLSARLDLSLAGSLPLAQLPPGANYTGGPAKAREEAGAAASEAPGSGRRSRWASPWLWVGVGGAAVAAAGATAILLAGTEEEEEPTRPENGRLLFGFE